MSAAAKIGHELPVAVERRPWAGGAGEEIRRLEGKILDRDVAIEELRRVIRDLVGTLQSVDSHRMAVSRSLELAQDAMGRRPPSEREQRELNVAGAKAVLATLKATSK